MIEILLAVIAVITVLLAAGGIVSKMSSGFAKVQTTIEHLTKQIADGFHCNTRDHTKIFEKLEGHGKDIARLKGRQEAEDIQIPQ